MNEWMFIPAALFTWGIIKIWKQDGFFVPLPMGTVRQMLELAKVGKADTVYDLGSGDGRMVIEAVNTYNAKKAVGIEIGYLADLLGKLRMEWKHADAGRVRLVRRDMFDCPIGEATVVTFYLTPKLAGMMRPKLEKELKKGTRVVSAAHEIPGWTHVKKIRTGHFWTYLYVV